LASLVHNSIWVKRGTVVPNRNRNFKLCVIFFFSNKLPQHVNIFKAMPEMFRLLKIFTIGNFAQR